VLAGLKVQEGEGSLKVEEQKMQGRLALASNTIHPSIEFKGKITASIYNRQLESIW
jgi:hypothetical protein